MNWERGKLREKQLWVFVWNSFVACPVLHVCEHWGELLRHTALSNLAAVYIPITVIITATTEHKSGTLDGVLQNERFQIYIIFVIVFELKCWKWQYSWEMLLQGSVVW